MKRFLSFVLSLSLVVSPVQANVCSATDVVAVQRNVTELINKLPGKLRVPVHKLLNGDPTWNATELSLNETETRMLNEVLVEMHLLKHHESLDGGVIHVGGETQCARDTCENTVQVRSARWRDIAFGAIGFSFLVMFVLLDRRLDATRICHNNLANYVMQLQETVQGTVLNAMLQIINEASGASKEGTSVDATQGVASEA